LKVPAKAVQYNFPFWQACLSSNSISVVQVCDARKA
jgi:hypothetical protein